MSAHDTATDALTDRQYADEMERVNDRLRARVGDLELVTDEQYDKIGALVREVACRFEVPQSHAKGMAALKARVGHMAVTIRIRNKRIEELEAKNDGLHMRIEELGFRCQILETSLAGRDERIEELETEIAQWKDLAEQQHLSLVSMRKVLPASCR